MISPVRLAATCALSLGLLATGAARAAPIITVNPPAADWKDVAACVAAPGIALMVGNAGDAPLTIAAWAIGGPNAADFQVAGAMAPVTIPPGGSTILNVLFKTAALGQRRGTLALNSNDPRTPVVAISLVANAISGKPSLLPAAVDFGWKHQARSAALHQQGGRRSIAR